MTGSTLYVPSYPSFGSYGYADAHSQRMAKKVAVRNGFSATRTMTKRRKRRGAYSKTFKARVRDIPPAKHHSGISETVITDNQIFTMGITQGVGPGTGNNQRIGDSIFLEALKINGHFQSSEVSNGYKYRILVGYSGEEYGTLVLASGNLNTGELFLPSGGENVNKIVNPKSFTAIYDEVVDINSQIEGDGTIQSFRATIPLKRNFDYQQATSVYGKTVNLYVVVIGYAIGTVDASPIGAIYLTYDLIYKNN
jgi:hypothetical protein